MTPDQVERELRRVLPAGWTLSPVGSDVWTLSPPGHPDRAPISSFDILLRGDVVVVTHGNNDAGPGFPFRLRATLVRTDVFVDAEKAARMGIGRLGEELWRIVEENRPNQWGLD